MKSTLLVIVLALVCTGCGRKGKLTLPDNTTASENTVLQDE